MSGKKKPRDLLRSRSLRPQRGWQHSCWTCNNCGTCVGSQPLSQKNKSYLYTYRVTNFTLTQEISIAQRSYFLPSNVSQELSTINCITHSFPLYFTIEKDVSILIALQSSNGWNAFTPRLSLKNESKLARNSQEIALWWRRRECNEEQGKEIELASPSRMQLQGVTWLGWSLKISSHPHMGNSAITQKKKVVVFNSKDGRVNT